MYQSGIWSDAPHPATLHVDLRVEQFNIPSTQAAAIMTILTIQTYNCYTAWPPAYHKPTPELYTKKVLIIRGLDTCLDLSLPLLSWSAHPLQYQPAVPTAQVRDKIIPCGETKRHMKASIQEHLFVKHSFPIPLQMNDLNTRHDRLQRWKRKAWRNMVPGVARYWPIQTLLFSITATLSEWSRDVNNRGQSHTFLHISI